MKRDNEYIRELLKDLESQPDWRIPFFKAMNASEEEQKKLYHIQLLCDAGLMTTASKDSFRLTNQGHDYLDAIRDDGIWSKTKEAITKIGGSTTFEIIKAIATGFAKKQISQHTGIEL